MLVASRAVTLQGLPIASVCPIAPFLTGHVSVMHIQITKRQWCCMLYPVTFVTCQQKLMSSRQIGGDGRGGGGGDCHHPTQPPLHLPTDAGNCTNRHDMRPSSHFSLQVLHDSQKTTPDFQVQRSIVSDVSRVSHILPLSPPRHADPGASMCPIQGLTQLA